MSSSLPARIMVGNSSVQQSTRDIAISVQNLSKCYHIYGSPRDRLKQFILPGLQRLAGRPAQQYCREFWALKGISFEIKKGEAVGVLGRNGSGKSTLLQMICGTLNPTSGNIKTTGRIAALLELGAGFNPEFTGRENTYMNAAILGLSKEETDARFDDIAAFADIGDFIDQPVKTYSSGMLVRLAFSVAINVDPEILVVDEALSVGDELFQRKCFSRIEAIRSTGATILFVSHSGSQIIELCDRAMLLHSGEKLAIGAPKQIVGHYQKLLYAPAEKQPMIKRQIQLLDEHAIAPIDSLPPAASATNPPPLAPPLSELKESFDPNLKPSSTLEYESHGATIVGLPEITTLNGIPVNNLLRGGKYLYRYQVSFSRTVTNVRFGMSVKTKTGLHISGALTAASLDKAIPLAEAGKTATIEFLFNCYLNPGIYFMSAGAFGYATDEETVLHRKSDVVAFRVLPVQQNIETEIVSLGFEPRVDFK